MALLIAACAAFPRMWRPPPRWLLRRSVEMPAFWPACAVLMLGMCVALVHAWDVLDAARNGVEDDETWYLMHLPMQAGFAIAVPVAAAVAVLALASGVPGWWFAIVPPAGCAVWFGAVSVKYPDVVGSLGELTGWFASGWGIAIAVTLWTAGFLTTRARADGGQT